MYVSEKFLLEIGRRLGVIGIDKFKKILEHAAGSARRGDKLHNGGIGRQIFFPHFEVMVYGRVVERKDTVSQPGRGFEFEVGETGFETMQLFFDLLCRDSLLLQ